MLARKQVDINGNPCSKKTALLFQNIKEEQNSLRNSMQELRSSIKCAKTSASNILKHPISSLTNDIKIPEIVNKHPFISLFAASGAGFVGIRTLVKMNQINLNQHVSTLANSNNDSDYIFSNGISKIKHPTTLRAQIESELANTTSMVLRDVLSLLHNKVQRYLQTIE